MSEHTSARRRRLRFAPIAVAAGLAGAVLLSVSMTGTLSGFVASITNSTNSAATGALTMQEIGPGTTPVTCNSTDGGTVSTNSATCSTINKFGGSTSMVPGQSVSTAITIKNTGSVPSSVFTLTPGTTCTQASNGSANGTATDLCAKLNLTITAVENGTSTNVFSGTLASFATATAAQVIEPAAPAAGGSIAFTFVVQLASTAGNTYQGLSASMPMTWSMSS